jgi:hypothetical protein
MKCEEIEILLSAYVDGEVTEEEKQIVENHLNVCEICQTTVVEFSRLHMLYQKMERKEAPPDFRQRVTQRIEATPYWTWLSWRLPRLVYGVSFTLLVLLGVAIATFFIPNPLADQPWELELLDVDMFAENTLTGQSVLTGNEVLFEEERSIAEEILETMDFAEVDTSLSFDENLSSYSIFSVGEKSIAEEILESIDLVEADISLLFGDDRSPKTHVLSISESAQYVISVV